MKDSKVLPLDSFTRLLRAIYGDAPEPGVNLGLGPTHDPESSPGLIAGEAGNGLASVLNDTMAEVSDATAELLRGDYSRQRLAAWMEDTAAQVEEARENGLSDATPEHIMESVLHDDDSPEAIYGRRLVLAALKGVADRKEYDAGFDSWL